MRLTRGLAIKLVVAAALLGGAASLGALGGSSAGGRAWAQSDAARRPVAPPSALWSGLDPRRAELVGDRLVVGLPSGSRAQLTLDPGLQEHLRSELERFEVPYASVVAIEPGTGRVLAYVSHSTANPEAPDLALDPTPPTASVFKLITAAALVDAGVGPDTQVCYHGGSSRLVADNLEDAPERDRSCATLADAVGGSLNAVFAKLADRHLDTATLERYAAAFGFGHALPFDLPTRPSTGEIPERSTDRLEFARTSAGFWHMHMSPLHGALIAATFANDGRMPRAALVERAFDPSGRIVYEHVPEVFRSVIGRGTARAVGHMMELTVTAGTSRRSFHDSQGRPFVPGIRIAGKTGTLSGTSPYRGYTWWVGFAPVERPTIAVAALVVNTPEWRIKASYVAREALRHFFIVRPTHAAQAQEPPPPDPAAEQ